MQPILTAKIPGQPPSWNRSYRIVAVRGKPVIAKTKDAASYQAGAALILRSALVRQPEREQHYVIYEFRLAKDIDTDNVLKMLNDSLSAAIELDDRYFLPLVLSKQTGSDDPFVLVTIIPKRDAVVRIDLTETT